MEIKWDDSCSFIDNSKLQAWALDKGSTCAKLKNQAVTVDLLSVELVYNCVWCNYQQVGWLRTTVLTVNQQPWMFAQAWAGENSAAVTMLQSKQPLGESLFKDGKWLRSDFHYTNNKCLLELNTSASPAIFARCSSFKTSTDELCLLEIFLQHKMWD